MQLKSIKPFDRFMIPNCDNPMYSTHLIKQPYSGLIQVVMVTGLCQSQVVYLPENTIVNPCLPAK